MIQKYITRFLYITCHLSLTIGMMAAVDVIMWMSTMINGSCFACVFYFLKFLLKKKI